MPVRDAVMEDVGRIAELADTSEDAAEGMIRHRTVRVSVDTHADRILGMVSFDASSDAVQVTVLAGRDDRFPALLEEPKRFGGREGLHVEMVVPIDERGVRNALEDVGFAATSDGPVFKGRRTAEFRYTPEG